MTTSRIPDPVASPPRVEITLDAVRRIRTIGSGGWTVVSEATVRGFDGRVALIEPAETADWQTLRRFRSGIETWAELDQRERTDPDWTDSTFLVGVLDWDRDAPWLAVEYMDGGSLAAQLDSSPDGLAPERAVWIGECCCRGLELAHTAGVTHHHLDPTNVLFRSTPGESWDVPKLGDWGLAGASEATPVDRPAPTTAAPEQYSADEFGRPDTLTDVYQAGVIVYTMLTGVAPYADATESPMRATTNTGLPTPPSERRPALSEAVDRVVLTALAREKGDRYRSVRAFGQALDRLRTDGSLRSDTAPEGITTGSSESLPTDTADSHRSATAGGDDSIEAVEAESTEAGETDAVVADEGDAAESGEGDSAVAPEDEPTVAGGRGSGVAGEYNSTVAGEHERSVASERDSTVAGEPVVTGDSGRRDVAESESRSAATKPTPETWGTAPDDRTGRWRTLQGGWRRTGVVGESTVGDRWTESWRFQTDSGVTTAPVATADRVFVGTDEGTLYSVERAGGDGDWLIDLRAPIRSSPTLAGDRLYVGCHANYLYAFDPATGEWDWRSETDGRVYGSPAVVGDRVVTTNGDPISGATRRILSRPACHVRAFDAETGEERWATGLGRKVRSSPAVADGFAFVGCDDGSLYRLDVDDGDSEPVFHARGPIAGTPAVRDGTAYVGSDDGSLYAVTDPTGEPALAWQFDTDDHVVSSPAVTDDSVIVGSDDGRVYAVDRATGERAWAYDTGTAVRASPVVAGRLVVVGGYDGRLLGLDAETGECHASFETDGGVTAAVGLADGTLFVGTDEGTLHAIDTTIG